MAPAIKNETETKQANGGGGELTTPHKLIIVTFCCTSFHFSLWTSVMLIHVVCISFDIACNLVVSILPIKLSFVSGDGTLQSKNIAYSKYLIY